MIYLTVTYHNAPGARFDEDYYRNGHMPLAAEIWGDLMRDTSVERGLPGEDGKAPFILRAHIGFDSMEALGKAFSHPRIAELQADTAKYTDAPQTHELSEPWK